MTLARRLITLIVLLLSGCAGPAETRFEFTEIIMGVEARIVLFDSNEPHARTAARAAFDRMTALEGVMSDYRADSELMRLSRAGADPVPISADLYRVLARARAFSESSAGAFDVTLGRTAFPGYFQI